MNGSYAGAVANGSVFYRDVPPGHYHIAPQSYGRDTNQDKDVDVAPEQQLYCKIVSSRSWELGVGGSQSGFDRDTFYVWLMAPPGGAGRHCPRPRQHLIVSGFRSLRGSALQCHSHMRRSRRGGPN
jgi:hypothetical protein